MRINLLKPSFIFHLDTVVKMCGNKDIYLFAHVGHCMANEQYIEQLKETLATSVPSRIAAFFGEPIQVLRNVVLKLSMLLIFLLLLCCFSTLSNSITVSMFGFYSMLQILCLLLKNTQYQNTLRAHSALLFIIFSYSVSVFLLIKMER